MEITFRKCVAGDLHALHALSCQTFSDAFAHLNTPDNMARYLNGAFHPDKLASELENAQSRFDFLYADGALAGYIKCNTDGAQTDVFDPSALEIERIYVKKAFQGQGLGGALIARACDSARSLGKTFVWLGVWEKNAGAIRFYERHGFVSVGQHAFYLGDDAQTDIVMRKAL